MSKWRRQLNRRHNRARALWEPIRRSIAESMAHAFSSIHMTRAEALGRILCWQRGWEFVSALEAPEGINLIAIDRRPIHTLTITGVVEL